MTFETILVKSTKADKSHLLKKSSMVISHSNLKQL
jgi:hypothetical protein